MVTKEQFMKGLYDFIERDMVPKSSGNYKIILNVAKAAIKHNPDAVFNTIKANGFISMLGVFDENDHIDVESLSHILSEGFGSDEFEFGFKFLGKEYCLHLSGTDIQTLKRYM